MKEKVTSTDIKRALAEKHWRDFFLTEVKSGPTQLAVPGDLKILDGLAIRKSWTAPCFTGYEVKISRSDFLRDAKFYTYEELCNCLYIVCPKGMIERTELPESVGLMYYDPEKKTITTRKKPFSVKSSTARSCCSTSYSPASIVTATRFSPQSRNISRNTSPESGTIGSLRRQSRPNWYRTTLGSKASLGMSRRFARTMRYTGRYRTLCINTASGYSRQIRQRRNWIKPSPESTRRIYQASGGAWRASYIG